MNDYTSKDESEIGSFSELAFIIVFLIGFVFAIITAAKTFTKPISGATHPSVRETNTLPTDTSVDPK